MKKKIIFTSVAILLLAVSFVSGRYSNRPLRDYEYRLIVDGTTSQNIYFLYDCNDKPVGTANSSQIDELIDNDNL